jgi:hypothetical protein
MDPVEQIAGIAPVVQIKARRNAGWLTWKRTEVDGRPARYGEAGTGPPVLFLPVGDWTTRHTNGPSRAS